MLFICETCDEAFELLGDFRHAPECDCGEIMVRLDDEARPEPVAIEIQVAGAA
jgi:predicted nucleic acid-binding Zn ribbon protein